MAEGQPPAVVSFSAAPLKDTTAVNEQQASQSSPAASNKTTIISAPDQPAWQKPKPSHTFTVSEYLVTGQKPPRPESQPNHTSTGPPLPPLVVRSDKTQGVVDHARRLLENSPAWYLCFFPQCGYTIYDAWDSHDIHIDSAEFLTEVLMFITRDNVHRAQTYAHEWSQKNRYRLDFIAGEVPRMYNSNDPLSIVDRIFVDGETQSYPREFLWHVVSIMRTGMVNAALKPQGTTPGDTAQNAERPDDNRAGNDALDINSAKDAEPNITAEEKKTRPEINHSSGTDIVPPLRDPLIVSSSTAPTVVRPPPATHPTQTPPFVPSQPAPKGYPNQPAGYVMGGPPNTLSPHMNASSMRYPKGNRNARQGSGSTSYNQPPPHQGRIENHPTALMSGNQPRLLSGGMSATHSPRFTAPLPMDIHPILNPGNPMMPFPQHPAMTLPHMAPGQISYGTMSGPMMHPSIMPSQSMPYGGSPMEFGQQNNPYGPPFPRGMQTGDMKNNHQHPYNAPPQRIEQHSGTNRRMSYTNKQPGLFNPYGAEKPDFGTIPPQQGSRKAGRNSFSDPVGRGQKASLSSYNRPGYGQHPFDRSDRNGPYGTNRQHEAPYPRSSSNNNLASMEVDPTITNDKERGCDEGWIGPNADYVTSLWVCNLPRDPDPTPEELTTFFEISLQVPVINVKISLDKNDSPIAYINFRSSDGVRKGLAINGHYHRGRPITVKVPRQYYTRQDPTRTQGSTYYSSVGNAQQSAKDVSRVPQSTSQPTLPFSRAPNPTHYSPQDARSGLPYGLPHSHAPDVPTQSGSPKARKPKKQQKSPNKKAKSACASTPQESGALTLVPTQDNAEERPAPPEAKEPIVEQHPSSIEQESKAVGASMEDAVDAKIVKKSTVAETSDVEPHFTVLQSAENAENLHLETSFITTNATDNDLPDPAASALENSTPFTTPLATSEPVQPAVEKQPQGSTLQEEPIELPVAQTPPEKQPVHGQTSESVDVAASASQPSVPIASSASHTELEEEDKNDLSYHSAQEMQSDPVAAPEEEEVPTIASGTRAATGIELPTTTSVEADTTPDPTVETIEPPTTGRMVSEPEKPKQAIDVPKQAAKTESLSIFAKSKAQKKKDKDAQKKEKKKAKASKAQPSFVPMPDVAAKAKAEPSNRPAPPPAAADLDSTSHAKTPVVAKVFQESVSMKMDLKNDQVATSIDSRLLALPTNDGGVQGDEEAVGGKLPVPREEITVETQVPKVQTESSAQSQNQDTGATASSYERASETEVSAENTDIVNAASAREKPSTQANETKQQHGKKSKTASNLKVAIPNLKDMERKSSASSRGSAIDPSSAKSKGAGEVLRNQAKVFNSDEDVPKGVKGEARIGTAPETASMASSTTLQGVASPIMSSSPTGSKFHTPMQTPTAVAKPKKKKKSKSKKKAPTDPDEPFAGQLHEIEEAKGSLKGEHEVPYYNKHAAQAAETPEESAALDKQIADSDLIALVQAYYPQKETLVQPHIERSFDLQNQDAAIRGRSQQNGSGAPHKYQPLSSEILSEVIEGRKVPHGQQILEKDDREIPKAGSIPFFLPKEEDE